MKHLYTTLSALMFAAGITANAQEKIKNPGTDPVEIGNELNYRQVNSFAGAYTRGGGSTPVAQSNGDTIFYESFGSGFAGDDTNGTWSYQGQNGSDWEYRGPQSSPDNTVGSRGAYSSGAPSEPIVSETQNNGFVIFDSDYLDNGGQQNPDGSPDQSSGIANVPHIGLLESPSIDFTDKNLAYLSFYSFFRRFNGTCHLDFSIDDGNTWLNNERIDVYDSDFPSNTTTDNSEYLTISMPSAVAGEPNVKFRLVFDGSNSGYYMWMVDDITITEALQYDIGVVDVDLDQNLIFSNAPFDIAGTIHNFGYDTINSYDVSYMVDGDTFTENIQNTLHPFDDDQFTHSQSWNPASTGQYEIKVWTSNLDGAADMLPENDTVVLNVVVVDNYYQKIPLYEVLTSSTCGPCRPGNENFHNIVDSREGEFVAIKYQQNFPGSGDPYATDESVSRRSHYGVTSIPNMQIDGGWDGNANSFTLNHHLDARSEPSFLDMGLEFEINADNQDIDFELNIDASLEYEDVVLHVAVLEGVTYDNVKSNGETEFHQVMKKMLPDENGRTISVSPSNPYLLSEGYTFNGSYRLPASGSSGDRIDHDIEHSVEDIYDIYVIAWVQDPVTDEVFQSVKGIQNFDYDNQALAQKAEITENELCENVIEELDVKFRNYGNLTMNSATIEVEINGVIEESQNWNGNIAPGKQGSVSFSNVEISDFKDVNDVIVKVENPNGVSNSDTNMSRTSIEVNQVNTGAGMIYIHINTDRYGEEVSWEIKNSSGDIVKSVPQETYPDLDGNTTALYIDSLEFTDEDCFTFTIYDEFGDGMAWQVDDAYARIISEHGDTLVNIPGNSYSDEASRSYRHILAPVSDNLQAAQNTTYNLYPNPTSSNTTVEINTQNEINLSIDVFDAMGQLVMNTQNQSIHSGVNQIQLNTSSLSSGMYFVSIKNESGERTVKQLIVK